MGFCEFGGCDKPAGYEVLDDDEMLMLCRDHAAEWGVDVALYENSAAQPVEAEETPRP